MVKTYSEERYNASFDEMMGIVNARNPKGSNLTAHIWGGPVESRVDEITSTLTGKNSEYDTHRISEGQAGAKTLSCTGLSVNRPCDLFPENITGILFKDAKLVHVSRYDSHSFHTERDGKLILEAATYSAKGPTRIELDVADPKVHKNAQKSYNKMFTKPLFSKSLPTGGEYNEICLNAELGNAAGILLNDTMGQFDLSADSWQERLGANEHLATHLSGALEEYDQVAEKMEAAGVNAVPTIMIYDYDQEQHKVHYTHFPPTQKNRDLVISALEQKHTSEADTPAVQQPDADRHTFGVSGKPPGKSIVD